MVLEHVQLVLHARAVPPDREPGGTLDVIGAPSVCPDRSFVHERLERGEHIRNPFERKVADVEPVRVMGAEGYPYGFNVSTEDGKPVVSFAYASRALAEAAATHLESALLNAISVQPYAD